MGNPTTLGLLGKILIMPRVPLLTSTFNKSNGGPSEYCVPNASLMNGN